eukprot:5537792-Alexandrium_andersonii.AAC.1
MAEYFAGEGNLSAGFRQLSYSAASFDLKSDANLQNLMTSDGMMVALSLALMLRPLVGFGHFGTVCSTWIWLSRSSTGRSESNPLGNGSVTTTYANEMVSRSAMLMLLLHLKP